MKRSVLVTLTLCGLAASAFAQPSHVRVVRTDAPPGGDGRTWQTAYQHPQLALDEVAAAPGTFTQIWIAAGEYVPTRRTDPADPRSATFMLLDDVSLFGGFAGGEQTLGERLPAANVTILQGSSDPGVESGVYHIITGSGIEDVTIDGLTIRGGDAMFVGPIPTEQGAGLRLINASITIINCRIRENQATTGGGMYISGGAVVVDSTEFIGNHAYDLGGAVRIVDADVNFLECRFEDNTILPATGDGVAINSSESELTVTECHFTGTAGLEQSVVRIAGGSALLETSTFEDIVAGIIVRGGMHIGNTFRNNDMIQAIADATVINTLIADNTVRRLQLINGAVADSNVINSTIINNTADDEWLPSSTVGVRGGTVVNSILWGNCFLVQQCDQDAQVVGAAVDHSLVQGWRGDLGGTGNFSADPLLADALGRLQPTSPAIDAGDNTALPSHITTDLDGNPRFHQDTGMPDRGIPGGAGGNAIIDLGAFEFQGTTCYANCDNSTSHPILTVDDFTCFIDRFAAGDPYANCDGSTTEPILTIDDFTCFINAFAAGCP